jgi:hypothetical protein
MLPLTIAETPGALGILGDRLAHDVALGLAEPLRRLPDAGDRRLVEGIRDACHNVAILP